jgi:diaminohydroxyphosphoribosylaminopyrimidine deaminase/5-amino-6-(5-phosphoribosylamino)uracil reductase
LLDLLTHLSEQGMTNVLVEGGSRLFGSLHDLNQIDEIHIFIGPKILGGFDSLSPLGGAGHLLMSDSSPVKIEKVEQIDGDVYIVGRVKT